MSVFGTFHREENLDANEMCVICHNTGENKEGVYEPEACKHKLHEACARAWMDRSLTRNKVPRCPTCRAKMDLRGYRPPPDLARRREQYRHEQVEQDLEAAVEVLDLDERVRYENALTILEEAIERREADTLKTRPNYAHEKALWAAVEFLLDGQTHDQLLIIMRHRDAGERSELPWGDISDTSHLGQNDMFVMLIMPATKDYTVEARLKDGNIISTNPESSTSRAWVTFYTQLQEMALSCEPFTTKVQISIKRRIPEIMDGFGREIIMTDLVFRLRQVLKVYRPR